ncbi:hypothetical protein M422DRAFT_32020 [Sphaerobolus stellatus SS14]|uniref:Sensor domain-containing protein n=1 Tax=Sphaerobolus stellatus (strain SS14) TaxID=990650 RepID=A0A0C9VSC2_SPHS4|nr:hypothetical protein M422DRAFT_32020 [Sphaerobolus stellatus SS14]
MSLFQAEHDEFGEEETLSVEEAEEVPFSTRVRRYFRPLIRKAYYAALFHLLLINIPYEILAWVYLFVGTVTGTTLLIALPIGAILCFIDLLGARLFSRGEIALQTKFHGPLGIHPPNPSNPIFARYRPLPRETDSMLENGSFSAPTLVKETSFLRLSYLMFTDPTSYRALFYFLVIKPGVTLIIFLITVVLIPPAFILIIPAPAILRAIRRIGIWQAEVAIDALS